MSSAVKVVLRIVVVFLFILAIAGAVLYFTTRVEEQKQVYASYSELQQDSNFKSLNEKLAFDETNKFLIYGTSMDYRSICACYDADLTIFDDLCSNLYYVTNSDANSRKQINEKLLALKTTAAETITYIQIFEATATAYGAEGNNPLTEKGKELKGIFKLLEQKFSAHARIMCQVSALLYDFAVKYSLSNGSSYSLRYQLMHVICLQTQKIGETENVQDWSKYYQAITKFSSKYKTEKLTNFISASNVSASSFEFLDSWSKLKADVQNDFIGAFDKVDYYNQSESTDKPKLAVVMNYFGI